MPGPSRTPFVVEAKATCFDVWAYKTIIIVLNEKLGTAVLEKGNTITENRIIEIHLKLYMRRVAAWRFKLDMSRDSMGLLWINQDSLYIFCISILFNRKRVQVSGPSRLDKLSFDPSLTFGCKVQFYFNFCAHFKIMVMIIMCVVLYIAVVFPVN